MWQRYRGSCLRFRPPKICLICLLYSQSPANYIHKCLYRFCIYSGKYTRSVIETRGIGVSLSSLSVFCQNVNFPSTFTSIFTFTLLSLLLPFQSFHFQRSSFTFTTIFIIPLSPFIFHFDYHFHHSTFIFHFWIFTKVKTELLKWKWNCETGKVKVE